MCCGREEYLNEHLVDRHKPRHAGPGTKTVAHMIFINPSKFEVTAPTTFTYFKVFPRAPLATLSHISNAL